MTYELTSIAVRTGSVNAVLAKLEPSLGQAPGGELLACWYSELGMQNRILVVREGSSQANAQRDALLQSDDPFGIGDALVSWESDSFAMFPGLPPILAGGYGNYYEVRTYALKPGTLRETIALWVKALPERVKLSPCVGVMYALTGTSPRFLHIWPYKSLDERQATRKTAVELGVWPPPGGAPGRILTQQVDVYRPAAFSPLR